jgi:hypothetical protein
MNNVLFSFCLQVDHVLLYRYVKDSRMALPKEQGAYGGVAKREAIGSISASGEMQAGCNANCSIVA